MNIRRRSIIPALLSLTFCLLSPSCEDYNYTEQLQSLGKRVEALEKWVAEYNRDLSALQVLVETVEARGYITKITENSDGSYTFLLNNEKTMTISNGRQGKDGRDGRDGREIGFTISVEKDTDGIWYWTLNGEWILDGDGNKLRATPLDGKDGRDGQDGRDGTVDPQNPIVIPQMRINEETRHWEISIDGGTTWEDTGIAADGKDGTDGKDGKNGKDGKDGKDGQDGPDDVFVNIIESEDGNSITFVLADGKTFTIPIIK